MSETTMLIAFIAGIVSFLSPCILPLVPAYMTFIAGTSVNEVKENADGAKLRVFISSVFFVLGFSLVFSVLGVLLQGALSGIAYSLRTYLNYAGGLIIIFFGLFMLGIIRLNFLEQEHKLYLKNMQRFRYIGSFLFGAAFAVGWTPCVGAVLGSVLTLAITDPASAFPLMLSYSLGLGVPFLLAGAFISQATGFVKAIRPYLDTLNTIFGILLVIIGILVFTGTLGLIVNLFPLPQFFNGS